MPDGTEFLKINIVSVPEKGKANQELIGWLSKKLKIAKSDITIVSGELDRYKKLMILSSEDNVISALNALLGDKKS